MAFARRLSLLLVMLVTVVAASRGHPADATEKVPDNEGLPQPVSNDPTPNCGEQEESQISEYMTLFHGESLLTLT